MQTHRIRPTALVAVALLAHPVAHAQTDDTAIDAVAKAWAAAFNECSAEKVAALYDERATLWGTASVNPITSQASVRNYFEGACAMQPRPTVELGERTTRSFGGSATVTGVYTFARGGTRLPARFSFTLLRDGATWRIVQHHSSPMPGRP